MTPKGLFQQPRIAFFLSRRPLFRNAATNQTDQGTLVLVKKAGVTMIAILLVCMCILALLCCK
jgi:hypothetical protein